MIILREKNYTKADREAMTELYRATNGFKTSPESFKNMSYEDSLKFKKLLQNITQINSNGGDLSGIDLDEDKKFLSNMGLSKVANQLEHLYKKSFDTKLLDRYKKINGTQKAQNILNRRGISASRNIESAHNILNKRKSKYGRFALFEDQRPEKNPITEKQNNGLFDILKLKDLEDREMLAKSDESFYSPSKDLIALKDDATYAALEHEKGHRADLIKTIIRKNGGPCKITKEALSNMMNELEKSNNIKKLPEDKDTPSNMLNRSLFTLGLERSATSNAMNNINKNDAEFKKLGLTDFKDVSHEELEDAYNTYITSAAKDIIRHRKELLK